jgi:hypothetical protein
MRQRCSIKSKTGYKNYGGRGIVVCEEWNNLKTGFVNFYKWSMTNGYKENLSIDRINVNGNYEPNNCRWITIEDQLNNKRNTIWVTIDSKTKTLKEWHEITGIKTCVLFDRYKNGQIEKEQFFKPTDKHRIYVTYNKKNVNLHELSKLTGITYDNLHDKYTKGLCNDQLWK